MSRMIPLCDGPTPSRQSPPARVHRSAWRASAMDSAPESGLLPCLFSMREVCAAISATMVDRRSRWAPAASRRCPCRPKRPTHVSDTNSRPCVANVRRARTPIITPRLNRIASKFVTLFTCLLGQRSDRRGRACPVANRSETPQQRPRPPASVRRTGDGAPTYDGECPRRRPRAVTSTVSGGHRHVRAREWTATRLTSSFNAIDTMSLDALPDPGVMTLESRNRRKVPRRSWPRGSGRPDRFGDQNAWSPWLRHPFLLPPIAHQTTTG